mmetsp:Transcript_7918/g.13802  ORF Transcript_7918/g.13802 Transcript_7918/m.13802 type:complete len:455 (-) Transcript_7918:84-1448(-)
MPFVEPSKKLQWSLLLDSVDKAVKEANRSTYEELLDWIFTADPGAIGQPEDDEAPHFVDRISTFLVELKDEDIAGAAENEILVAGKENSAGFQEQYSGLSKLSQFMLALSKHISKTPKLLIKCITERFKWKKAANQIHDKCLQKKEYYDNGTVQELISAIDGAVSNEMAAISREMVNQTGMKEKSKTAKPEYTSIERILSSKGASKIAKQAWVAADRQDAIIPLLYMLNVLNLGDGVMIKKNFQKDDAGRWSPNHVDLLLNFARNNTPPGDSESYEHKIIQACDKVAGLGKAIDLASGLGVQIINFMEIQKDVSHCKRVSENAWHDDTLLLMQELQELEATTSNNLKDLLALEMQVYHAVGPVAGRLAPKKDAEGNPTDEIDYEQIKKQARQYAKDELNAGMDTKGAAPKATTEKVYLPQAIFDDFTLHNGLLTFCKQVSERKEKVGTFHRLKH